MDSDKWFVPRTKVGLWLRNLNYRLMGVLPTGRLVELKDYRLPTAA